MSRIYACVYIVLYNNNNVDGKKANLHIICRIHEYQQNWVHYQVSSQELYGMNYHTYTLLAWKLNRIIVRSHITSSGMWCIATKYTCRIANFLKHSKYMDTFWAKQMRHIGSIAKNQEKGGRRQREKRIRAHSNNLEFFFLLQSSEPLFIRNCFGFKYLKLYRSPKKRRSNSSTNHMIFKSND